MKVVIPARMASSRFHAKPLAMIAGSTLLSRVVDRAARAVGKENVIVATDHDEISLHSQSLGVRSVMTSELNQTGTDRVAEVMRRLGLDKAINVQGDEPLVDPDLIRRVAKELEHSDSVIHCWTSFEDESEFQRASVPKLVVSENEMLLYASRLTIPANKYGAGVVAKARKQVSIYGLNLHNLTAFGTGLTKTPLESVEDIEILRFLECGVPVKMIESPQGSIAVDYPEDVVRVEEILRALGGGTELAAQSIATAEESAKPR